MKVLNLILGYFESGFSLPFQVPEMFGDQMKGTNFWRCTHFPLNHDYGRKRKVNHQKKGDKFSCFFKSQYMAVTILVYSF